MVILREEKDLPSLESLSVLGHHPHGARVGTVGCLDALVAYFSLAASRRRLAWTSASDHARAHTT